MESFDVAEETLHDGSGGFSSTRLRIHSSLLEIGDFRDTDDMNEFIKDLLSDNEINQSSTVLVLNTSKEDEQFELDSEY